MALVREYRYRDREIKVTVSRSGTRYVGIVQIAGMIVPPTLREVYASSEEHAFTLGRRKGEELIDHPPPPPGVHPE
jgi:hypothetical protein